MTAVEQWQKVQDLFHAALEREPRDRLVFLDEACSGNEALRKEVARLISAHETEDHFIDAPAYVAAADVLADGLALQREFAVTETVKFQIRAEAFNALNHTNLGTPNRFVNTPQFGTITEAVTPAREIQLGVRISF